MGVCKSFFGIDEDFFSGAGCAYTSEEIASQPSLWVELGKMLLERKNEATGFIEGLGGSCSSGGSDSSCSGSGDRSCDGSSDDGSSGNCGIGGGSGGISRGGGSGGISGGGGSGSGSIDGCGSGGSIGGGLGRMRIVFTGAGSSAFIGDALSALIAKNTGLKTESIHSTDIVSAPESYLFADCPTLLVSFARSGNSPESVGAVEYARAVVKDLYEVAIVCDGESNLAVTTALSPKSLILVMPEGSNDRGFAMTSSVSCMMLAGFALFNLDRIEDIVGDINLLSVNTSAFGPVFTEAARKWAEKDFGRVAYLGSGFLKHLAHEASLKMMELTNGGVNGAYESAAGFRHGPKSVINDRTLTVHMISNNSFTARYDMDLLNEVASQQKGNMIVVVCPEGIGGPGDTFGDPPGDETVSIASGGYTACGDICTGLQSLVFCQMLAMFKSLSLGVATDNPSPTGEVNRVVKGVTIYEY